MGGTVGYHSGREAEGIVERAYEAAGHPVRHRRWRGAGGEIDLVAEDSEGLIFIEVKKARDFARAAERVSQRQMQRIAAAATEFLGTMPLGQLTQVRFDVALVDRIGRVKVVENAFGH